MSKFPKECKECKEVLDQEHYYRAGKYWQTRCKLCYNKINRYVKKGKSTIINEDMIKEVKEMLKEGFKKKDIAKKYNITPVTFLAWRKKGIFD